MHALKTYLRLAARGLLLITACLLALLAVISIALRWVNPPVTAFMLQQAAADQRVYEWTPIEAISDVFLLAVIAAEDQRFPEHAGIDLESLEAALTESGRDGGMRGASTITQQLSKNLFLWPGRSLIRKAIEAVMSLMMDALLPKRRILELYANVVELGPGIYGVGAASRIYFAQSAAQLTEPEAALLAAVLPNPRQLNVAAPSEYLRERQVWVLEQMQGLKLHWQQTGYSLLN
jgi:monofunctional biosynthetic peptidoglycan transglycosylase